MFCSSNESVHKIEAKCRKIATCGKILQKIEQDTFETIKLDNITDEMFCIRWDEMLSLEVAIFSSSVLLISWRNFNK